MWRSWYETERRRRGWTGHVTQSLQPPRLVAVLEPAALLDGVEQFLALPRLDRRQHQQFALQRLGAGLRFACVSKHKSAFSYPS